MDLENEKDELIRWLASGGKIGSMPQWYAQIKIAQTLATPVAFLFDGDRDTWIARGTAFLEAEREAQVRINSAKKYDFGLLHTAIHYRRF